MKHDLPDLEVLEELEDARQRRAWVLGAAGVTALFLFVPLAWATGLARFFKGPGMLSLGLGKTLGLYLPLFVSALYIAVLAPLLKSGFLKPLEKPSRLFAALALWGLPLVSFAYYIGDFRNSLHAYDVGVFVVGALAVPLTIYWRTGSTLVLGLGVGLIAFIPMFVVEDILGPFSPLWVYASEGPGFYSLRTLCSAGALAVVALLPVPRVGRNRGREELFRTACIAMAVVSFCLFLGEWVFPESGVTFEVNWVGYVALVHFFRRGDGFARKTFLALCLVQAVSLFFQLGLLVAGSDGGYGTQLRLWCATVGCLLTGLEARRRMIQERWLTSAKGGSAAARSVSKKVGAFLRRSSHA